MKARARIAAIFGRSHRGADAAPAGDPAAARRRRGRGASALGLAAFLLAFSLAVSVAAAEAPTVAIDPVGAVGYTTAQVSGDVDPKDAETYWYFETQTEGGGWSYAGPFGSIPANAGETSVLHEITGLAPGKEYEVRLVATNFSDPEAISSTEAFETDPVAAPAVTVNAADAIAAASAHFSGSVEVTGTNPAFDASCSFDYIKQDKYEAAGNQFTGASSIACEPSTVKGSESQPVEVTADPALEPNTAYRFRIRAGNAGGSSSLQGAPFSTPEIGLELGVLPTVPLSPTSVRVRGVVNPRNSALTVCRFAWGANGNFDHQAPCTATPTGNAATPVEATLTGLQPSTSYGFRLEVANGVGSLVGQQRHFRTAATASAPSCANADSIGGGFLPDCRAWELVSPPDKLGGDVITDSARTRAATNGDAIGFMSLGGFGDVQGAAIGVDYIARRSSAPDPGDNGWSTHAITPLQKSPIPLPGVLTEMETRYEGEFSPDLDTGVVTTYSPLTDDPNVRGLPNLYRRTDLLTPGTGTYDLLSACPLCEASDTPLPPLPGQGLLTTLRPFLAWASPDLSQIGFESKQALTADAPAQPGICDMVVRYSQPDNCRPRAYEWDEGNLRFAGVLEDPALCAAQTPSTGAPCAADGSIVGGGAGVSHSPIRSPHSVSDGSDGHTRVFFTQPTDGAGNSSSAVSEGEQPAINGSFSGRLFMRVDGTSTEQVDRSERTDCAGDPTCGGDGEADPAPTGSSPATFLDATPDGTRVFFKTGEKLTDDTPLDSLYNIYMYDASKPESSPDNLTLLSVDENEADGANVHGLIGASEDGSYVYMAVNGQLVEGEPTLGATPGIYLWHEGEVSFIGSSTSGNALDEQLGNVGFVFPQQARVTPDGRHLLLSAVVSSGLSGDDHGSCATSLGKTCRELYVYSADSDRLECASCNPSGAPAVSMATAVIRENNGGAKTSWHQNRAISDDGRYVFFSTGERLVPEDINGVCAGLGVSSSPVSLGDDCFDAYVYDTATGKHHLLSSGRGSAAAYFMDASPDGKDAFFATREQLSAWDVDGSYDLYDARIDGGFPEPPPAPPACVGDACQPAPKALDDPTPGSMTGNGPGNLKERKGQRARCPSGKKRVKVRGSKTKSRCVKANAKQKKGAKQKQRANNNRRAGR